MKSASNRVQLTTFLVLTALVTGALQWLIVAQGGLTKSGLLLPLMWTPGLVAIGCTILFGKPLSSLGLTRFRARFLSYSYGVPCLAAVLVWTSLVTFGIGKIGINSSLLSDDSGPPNAWAAILLMASAGVVLGVINALGEELGWRGFLHNRLRDSGVAHPHLVIGLIWAIWHWPLIILGGYADSDLPLLSVALFTCTIVSYSVFLGWLRERTGSVWQASIAHSTHNVWMQGIYPSLLISTTPVAQYVGGESGAAIAVIYFLVAVLLYRRDPTGKFLGGRVQIVLQGEIK